MALSEECKPGYSDPCLRRISFGPLYHVLAGAALEDCMETAYRVLVVGQSNIKSVLHEIHQLPKYFWAKGWVTT